MEILVYGHNNAVIGMLQCTLATLKSGNRSRWHVLKGVKTSYSVGLLQIGVEFREPDGEDGDEVVESINNADPEPESRKSGSNPLLSHCKGDFQIPDGSILRVRIVKGENLLHLPQRSSARLYTAVKVGNRKAKTKSIGWKDGQDPRNPVWDEVLQFAVPPNFNTNDSLRFKVLISGPIVSNLDMCVHEASIPFRTLMEIVEIDEQKQRELAAAGVQCPITPPSQTTEPPQQVKETSSLPFQSFRSLGRRLSQTSIRRKSPAAVSPQISDRVNNPEPDGGSLPSISKAVWIPLTQTKGSLRPLPAGASYTADGAALFIELELIPSAKINCLCMYEMLNDVESTSVDNVTIDEDHVISIQPITPPTPLPFELLDMEVGVSVSDLEYILLDPQSGFTTRFCEATGYKNVNTTPWVPPAHPDTDPCIKERVFTYLMPASRIVKANMVTETQRITQKEPGGLVMEVETSTPEVPFGTSFLTHLQYVMQYVSPNTSRLLVTCEARFKKNTYMKGVIVKGMQSGMMDTFAIYARQLDIVVAQQPLRESTSSEQAVAKTRAMDALETGVSKVEGKSADQGITKPVPAGRVGKKEKADWMGQLAEFLRKDVLFGVGLALLLLLLVFMAWELSLLRGELQEQHTLLKQLVSGDYSRLQSTQGSCVP
eukprot:Colp12_sorted_trinity150504_noHs@34777